MKTAFRIVRIIPCAERVALNARGLFGFHDSPNCPNCRKTDEGFRVHDSDSIFSPFVGYFPDNETAISENPIYITR